MANYVGVGRSNAFRVADSEKFLQWLETVPDVRAVEEGEDTYVLLYEGDGAGWPFIRFLGPLDEEHEDEDDEEEFDIFAELSEHLEEGQVAVLEEVGSEKLRYLVGYAVAVNHCSVTI